MSELVEEWDSEMDQLVKWLNTYSFPPYPFKISAAEEVVGDKFFENMRMMIDQCEFRKDLIPDLRYKMKRIKAYVESVNV